MYLKVYSKTVLFFQLIYNTAKECGFTVHNGGTMLTIEGPRFSSKAESKMWNSWGAHCINMTTVPEVRDSHCVRLCQVFCSLTKQGMSFWYMYITVQQESLTGTFPYKTFFLYHTTCIIFFWKVVAQVYVFRKALHR